MEFAVYFLSFLVILSFFIILYLKKYFMTNLTKLTDNLDHRFSEENFKAILDLSQFSLISSSKTLSDINTNEITKALKPFESQLKQFSTFYQTSVATEARDRNKLRGEITNISRNAIALSEDAQNQLKLCVVIIHLVDAGVRLI